MNSVLRKLILVFLWLYVVQFTCPAQINWSKYEIGAQAGIMVYQGDLTPSAAGSFKTLKPQLGIFASRILSNSFAARASLVFGGVKGDDARYDKPAWRKERSFNFSSSVTEFSGMLVWNILGKNNLEGRSGFSPYVMAGVGYSFLNIKRDWSRLNITFYPAESDLQEGLNEDIAHRLPKGIPVLPLGIGVRYSLSSKWALSAESSYRHTFTDYLDGFSQSGNPKRNDHYYSHSLGVNYRLGRKSGLDCPVIRF
jgi:opacity protein-like surface antigen